MPYFSARYTSAHDNHKVVHSFVKYAASASEAAPLIRAHMGFLNSMGNRASPNRRMPSRKARLIEVFEIQAG